MTTVVAVLSASAPGRLWIGLGVSLWLSVLRYDAYFTKHASSRVGWSITECERALFVSNLALGVADFSLLVEGA